MRTRVLPGGATSVRGGPADTAADVAGAVRALLGVGPSVRPSWGPSVVVVVVVVVRAVGPSVDGAPGGRVVAVAAAARSSSVRSIVPLSTQAVAHGARRKFRGSFATAADAALARECLERLAKLVPLDQLPQSVNVPPLLSPERLSLWLCGVILRANDTTARVQWLCERSTRKRLEFVASTLARESPRPGAS